MPEVKNCWDTQNFDPYEEEEPWYPTEQKGGKGKKKNPEFIGYTYKPMEENNSALVKALVDLDSYKPSTFTSPVGTLDYLQLESDHSNHSSIHNRFKKKADKTERINV